MNAAAFLHHQSRAYVYATDIEAGALAEIMGVTFACTQVGANNLATQPPCIYYRSAQENVAIIHLYNRSRDHFFVIEGQYSSTIGDGNCLYNGFIQLMRQFILEEEQNAINMYINQAQIYNQIRNLPSVPVAELIARVRMQHNNRTDQASLNAAIRIAQEDKQPVKSFYAITESGFLGNNIAKDVTLEDQQSDVTLSAQKKKLLLLIHLMRKQGHALNTKDHQDKANQLTNTLENKTNLFFNLPHQEKQNRFPSFKKECVKELTDAKSWLNAPDYQQICLDIFQTLTVIGALLGVAQWFITGRYSLFSTPTTTLLETIEKTNVTAINLNLI